MTTQELNAEMINLLSSHFVLNDTPTTAWGSTISMFLSLPGLRGFWPMSSVDALGTYDLSGQGKTLAFTGTPTFSSKTVGLPPNILISSGNYVSRADEAGLDIIGTEGYIANSVSYENPLLGSRRGLTIGGWFAPSSLSNRTLMAKYNSAGNQKSYLLRIGATGPPEFTVSSDGATDTTVMSTQDWQITQYWAFCVGRFVPSSELAIWYGGHDAQLNGFIVKTINVTSIPASIFNSTASFIVGAQGTGSTEQYSGRASLLFLCACALPDRFIDALYYHTRSLFARQGRQDH